MFFLSYPRFTDVHDCQQASLLHKVAMWVWIGWLPVYLIGIPLLVWRFLHSVAHFPGVTHVDTIINTVIVIATYFLSTHPLHEKKPFWGAKLGEWIVHKADEYFALRVVLEDKESLAAAAPAVFTLEPHDVLPVSMFAFSSYLNHVSGHRCVGMMTSVCYHMPLLRQVYTW